jgi:GTP pyrophosphokinase
MDTSDYIDQYFEPLRILSEKRCANTEEYELVLKAYAFAKEAHKNQKRISGEPIIFHNIDVARILVEEIGLGNKSIIAGLLHHTLSDTEYTKEDISGLFGEKIAELVEGLGKMERVFAAQDKTQEETFKQMLLTVNNDIRVLLIKLADRLHNLRNVDELPVEKRARNLGESMYIFAPLAHQLGLYTIKSEIENIWMKYAMPAEYVEIQEKVKKEMGRLDKALTIKYIEPITALLKQEGLDFKMTTRIKTPYSIWAKMKKRNVVFEDVFDLYALRIVFQPPVTDREIEHQLCYKIEALLNEYWEPYPERRRDWLKTPKETGYEALHSTYLTPSGNWLEVQIRSRRMDDIAEQGIAAHWKYKGIVPEVSGIESWLVKVRQTLEDKDTQSLAFFDHFRPSSLISVIYIFTPKGEMRILPKGATALDFAYYIHTHVGHHALAAKINEKLKLLSTPLSGGDQVEIITTDDPQVKIERLSAVTTSKAKSLILEALKKSGADPINKGRNILSRKLAEFGIKIHTRLINKLLAAYNITSREELYGRIGAGMLDLSNLRDILLKGTPTRKFVSWVPEPDWTRRQDFNTFHFSPCCRPTPEDELIGFISKKTRDLYIHTTTCPRIEALKRLHKHESDRVQVSWKKQRLSTSLVKLMIRGSDRLGIIFDITHATSLGMCVNIRSFSLISHDNIFDAELEVYVQNNDSVQELMAELKKIKGVQTVKQLEQ